MNQQRDPERRRRSRRAGESVRRGDESSPEPVPPLTADSLVIVRFKGQRKGHYHNRNAVALGLGQYCLVQADRGCDLGQVLYIGRGTDEWWQQASRQGVLALASPADLARLADLRREEREARQIARARILEHGLSMQLVGAEKRWDRNKLTFYFLAEGRIDFRALVRDLASVFRTRIELRQIGVRDEARLKGGFGICGRIFCCASFLTDFNSVGLRMAKDQQLPLNPTKLSGPCGRLRCCLAFEHPAYRQLLQQMPRPGSLATWGERVGRVRKLDPLRGVIQLQLDGENQELTEVPLNALTFDRDNTTPAPGARAESAPDQAAPANHPAPDPGQRQPRSRSGRSRRRGRGRNSGKPPAEDQRE